MFTITKQWLEEHKTKRGGYTSAQLNVFGFRFPPPRGWQNALIGMGVSQDLKEEFESAKSKNIGIDNLRHAKNVINKLTDSDRKLLITHINNI